MIGRLFAIMGQKHSELAGLEPADSEAARASYKARVVFDGSDIQVANNSAAYELFQEVSGPPATMTDARIALAAAALTGKVASFRDAEQAYIQAHIDTPGRPKTYVRLPKSWWPQHWHGRFTDPCVPLSRALYGHPEIGALWVKHLATVLGGLNFEKVDGHPGVWWNPKSSSLLIVYVEDLLLVAGSSESATFWSALEKSIGFKDLPSPVSRYLGCNHTFS